MVLKFSRVSAILVCRHHVAFLSFCRMIPFCFISRTGINISYCRGWRGTAEGGFWNLKEMEQNNKIHLLCYDLRNEYGTPKSLYQIQTEWIRKSTCYCYSKTNYLHPQNWQKSHHKNWRFHYSLLCCSYSIMRHILC